MHQTMKTTIVAFCQNEGVCFTQLDKKGWIDELLTKVLNTLFSRPGHTSGRVNQAPLGSKLVTCTWIIFTDYMHQNPQLHLSAHSFHYLCLLWKNTHSTAQF